MTDHATYKIIQYGSSEYDDPEKNDDDDDDNDYPIKCNESYDAIFSNNNNNEDEDNAILSSSCSSTESEHEHLRKYQNFGNEP